MCRMGLLACALGLLALLALPGRAQDGPENGTENSRFSLFRTDEGYLRLDGRTGQMSICLRRQSRWLCQTVPDERLALEDEIGRLQAENATLKKVLLEHQLPLPAGMRADRAAGTGAGDAREPFRIRNALGAVWRRLVAFIASVQRDFLKSS
jgi:hypothetical protein